LSIPKANRLILFFLSFLLIVQFLIFSLNAIIALGLVVLVFMYLHFKTRRSLKFILSIYGLICTIVLTSVFFFKPFKNRLASNIKYDFEQAHIGYWNGITMRLAIW